MLEAELIRRYPTLYHMAESGTWPSIRDIGLLSTKALLDHLRAEPNERHAIFSSHRPESVHHRGVTIRDQKPMNHNLRSCLRSDEPGGIQPRHWFEFLNRKVFFSLTSDRLDRFRKAYGFKRQLIIQVATGAMIKAHPGQVTLCHLNSGATRMPYHYRNFDSFQPIAYYKYSAKNEPAELTVECRVDDIVTLATKVYEVGGNQPETILHQA